MQCVTPERLELSLLLLKHKSAHTQDVRFGEVNAFLFCIALEKGLTALQTCEVSSFTYP